MFNPLNKNVQSISKIQKYYSAKEKTSSKQPFTRFLLSLARLRLRIVKIRKQFFLFAAALGLYYLCTMNYLEVFGTLVGLVYLWLEYRASIYLWLACIVMPAIYLVVYYQAGLYADFGINVYYLLASVYGWIAWSRGRKKKNIQQAEEETPITRMPRKVYFPLTAVFILCWVVIAWILITWTDSSVPWTDSFTTALSIIAMWMLARKYVEQWGAWMIVDWVCCGLYIYKGLYFTSALYGLYAVVAFFGWRKWLSLMTEQACDQTNKE